MNPLRIVGFGKSGDIELLDSDRSELQQLPDMKLSNFTTQRTAKCGGRLSLSACRPSHASLLVRFTAIGSGFSKALSWVFGVGQIPGVRFRDSAHRV
jgi:hypothetical protein